MPEFQEYRARAYDAQAISYAKIQLQAQIANFALRDAGETSIETAETDGSFHSVGRAVDLFPEVPPKILTHSGTTGPAAGCVQECVVAGHELGTSAFVILEGTPIVKAVPMSTYKGYSPRTRHASTGYYCIQNLRCQ